MINRCMTQLVDDLRADEVADPLRENFLLAAVWDDLARLAGEVSPPHVRLVLDDFAGGGTPASHSATAPVSDVSPTSPPDSVACSRGDGR